jgi:CubicO group peptidase (beta-lactamase class C family)
MAPDLLRRRFTGMLGAAGAMALIAPASAQRRPVRAATATPPDPRGPVADPGTDWAPIDAALETARAAWRAPGLAFGIVKDDRIVYAKGFGHADLARTRPAGPDTIFNVASTTKAITAATVAMMVDEGKMDWDAPVRAYLKTFSVDGGPEYASISLRDMLSHRTGLPRHDLLWYNNLALSREALLDRVPHLKVSAPIRSRWQYNNLMYILAGHAVETVAGRPWELLTAERLFTPLAMRDASLSVEARIAGPDHSEGHRPDPSRALYVVPPRPEDRIGPAGALNVSVRDYLAWVRLMLGEGEIDGKRLISKDSHAAMWEPLIGTGGNGTAPDIGRPWYGLGWRVDDFRGRTRIYHGGNLNGFSARVTLFPEDRLGFVALSNIGGSPLPGHVTHDVFERLVGLAPRNWSASALARRFGVQAASRLVLGALCVLARFAHGPPRVLATAPSRPLAGFAGTYTDPGYGDMTIELNANGLRGIYNAMPARLEHWHYDVFNARPERVEDDDLEALKFVFETGASGQVEAVSVKMESLVAPVRFERRG